MSRQNTSPGRRLLVAEDEAVSRNILVRLATSWGYDVLATDDGGEAMKILEGDDPPRLAVLDWMMPSLDGVSICRLVRDGRQEPYIYIIVLTALQQRERLVEALEAGADDFLTKPVQPHELELRLRAGRRIVELQEKLIEAREELRKLATHDALTGIWNRRAILEILDKELARVSRTAGTTGLGALMIDIDHFKAVNDRYGHVIGDRVLAEVAARILGVLRYQDNVGRYGGEEFLAVVGDCDAGGLRAAGERVRRAVSATPIPTEAGPVEVTVSVGGAAAAGGGGRRDSRILLELADAALYRAKASGRNAVIIGGSRETARG